jgi:MoaA/NifB/PqqE/SkfB family radical SAM enzyme
MFNFNQLQDIHFEITNRCQASCPMCSRNYHGGLENPLIENRDWTVEDFKTIASDKVLNQLTGFYFCGNFGDPIINDDLIEMIEHAVSVNPKLNIRVHTNGSARKAQWWERLASALPERHNVVFAIDGLADTHQLYRIGTQYNTIIRNATAFINAGGHAEWCFIKFKHNEHQVEEAQHRATKLGFSRFTEKNSSRFIGEPKFPVYNKDGDTIYHLEPPSTSELPYISNKLVKNYKEILKDIEIECYVQQTKEIYIDAYRKVFPCCFLASAPYNYVKLNDIIAPVRKDMLDQYNSLVDDLGNTNALEKTLEEIIDSPAWQTVWKQYWKENKLITCAKTCGKLKEIPRPKDQFINIIGLKNE